MNVPQAEFAEHRFLVGDTLNSSVRFCREGELLFLSLSLPGTGMAFRS